MAVNVPRKLWTIEEYELLIEKGIFNKDTRVELIRGEILEMAPIGARHAGCVTALEALFHQLLGETVTVSVQNPIQLTNDSAPQPDVALLKGHWRQYARKRPTLEDILLLVEVADSTLGTDRSLKIPLYAEAGIPEVWLVNLDKNVIEVYSEPVDGQYVRLALMGQGKMLSMPGGLQGAISVDDVLG